jgi:hypothetical protein
MYDRSRWRSFVSAKQQAMLNLNHTRTLHIDFGDTQDDVYFQSEWTSTAIGQLEELSQALRVTLKNKDSKVFLRACEEASTVIQTLNDGGLKKTVAKLKAHFKKEIKLDDYSFRRNALRLQAIGSMLIEALIWKRHGGLSYLRLRHSI